MISISKLDLNDQPVEEQVGMVVLKHNNLIGDASTSVNSTSVVHEFVDVANSVQCTDMELDDFYLMSNEGGLHGESWPSESISQDEHDDICTVSNPSTLSLCATDGSLSSLSQDASIIATLDVLKSILKRGSEHTIDNNLYKEMSIMLVSIVSKELNCKDEPPSNFLDFIDVCGHFATNSLFLLGMSDEFKASSFPWDTTSKRFKPRLTYVLTIIHGIIDKLTDTNSHLNPSSELVLMHHFLALADLTNGKLYRHSLQFYPPILDLRHHERDEKKEEIGSSDGSTEDDTSESEFTPCMPLKHPVGITSDKSYNQSVLGVDSHVDLGCTTDFRKRFGFPTSLVTETQPEPRALMGGPQQMIPACHNLVLEINDGLTPLGEGLSFPCMEVALGPDLRIGDSGDASLVSLSHTSGQLCAGGVPGPDLMIGGSSEFSSDSLSYATNSEASSLLINSFANTTSVSELTDVLSTYSHVESVLGPDLRIGDSGDTTTVSLSHTNEQSLTEYTPETSLRTGESSDILCDEPSSTLEFKSVTAKSVSCDVIPEGTCVEYTPLDVSGVSDEFMVSSGGGEYTISPDLTVGSSIDGLLASYSLHTDQFGDGVCNPSTLQIIYNLHSGSGCVISPDPVVGSSNDGLLASDSLHTDQLGNGACTLSTVNNTPRFIPYSASTSYVDTSSRPPKKSKSRKSRESSAKAVGKPPANLSDNEDIPTLCEVDSDSSDEPSDDESTKSGMTGTASRAVPLGGVSSTHTGGGEPGGKDVMTGGCDPKQLSRGGAVSPLKLVSTDQRLVDSVERVNCHFLEQEEWRDAYMCWMEATPSSSNQFTSDPLLRKAKVLVYHHKFLEAQSRLKLDLLLNELMSMSNLTTNIHISDDNLTDDLKLQRREFMNKVSQLREAVSEAAIHRGQCECDVVEATTDEVIIRRWIEGIPSGVIQRSVQQIDVNKAALIAQLQANNESRLSTRIEGLWQSSTVESTMNSMPVSNASDVREISTHTEDVKPSTSSSLQATILGALDRRITLIDAMHAQANANAALQENVHRLALIDALQAQVDANNTLDNALQVQSDAQIRKDSEVGMSTALEPTSRPLHKSFSRFQEELTSEEVTCHSMSRLVQSPVHMASPGGGDSAWNPPMSHTHPQRSPSLVSAASPISVLEVQQISEYYGWSWLYNVTPPGPDHRSHRLDSCPEESQWTQGRPVLSVRDYEMFCLNQLRMAYLVDPHLDDEVRKGHVFESIQCLKGIAARGRANPFVPHIAKCGTPVTSTHSVPDGVSLSTATVFTDDDSLYEFRGGTQMLKSLRRVPPNVASCTPVNTSAVPNVPVSPCGEGAYDTDSDMESAFSSASNADSSFEKHNSTHGRVDGGDVDTAHTKNSGSSHARLRQDLLRLFILHTDTDTPDKIEQLEANLAKNFSDEKVSELISDPHTSHSMRVLLTTGVPETLLRAESTAGHTLCSEIYWDSGASLHITDFFSSLVEAMERLDPIKVQGVGTDVFATHTGFDPRWTGRFSFLSGGAGICVLSVGEACRLDQFGLEGFFLFTNEGAFTSRTTPEIKILLKLLSDAAKKSPGFATACKEHNVYVQKCSPELLARAQHMIMQSMQEHADITALAAILENRRTELEAILTSPSSPPPEVARATSAKVRAHTSATATTTPAIRRSVAGGGGSATVSGGPIAKASALMLRANVDNIESLAIAEITHTVTSSVNLRKRRASEPCVYTPLPLEPAEAISNSRVERDEARSARAANRNPAGGRGNYVYDARNATMVWTDFEERVASYVAPRVPEYLATAAAANEKFYSSETRTSSSSLSRQGEKSVAQKKTISHRHVHGGGTSWTSSYVSVASPGLSVASGTSTLPTDDSWCDPFPMHLRTSVCGTIRNSQTQREDDQYVRVKAQQGPIDPDNLSVRTNLKEYTTVSWNRAGVYSADFANSDNGTSSGEARFIFQQSNILHEFKVWEDWKKVRSKLYGRDIRHSTSIMLIWESSECGRTFPLREGEGRSPAEFLRTRTLSRSASCKVESVLVGGELAHRMESVVERYDLHKAQFGHMKANSSVCESPSVSLRDTSYNALGADYDHVLWNCEPSLALLVEMTHCLSEYKQEIILAMYLTHPGWLDLILANELAETELHLQIMSMIGLNAVEHLRRHQRYIIMMEQVINIKERHGSVLADDCYHTLLPSLTGELGSATVCYKRWPGITNGISNLLDTVCLMRADAIQNASVSLSGADMGIYANGMQKCGDMNLVDQINIHEALLMVYSELGMTQGRLRELPPEYFALNESIIRHFCRTVPHVEGVMQRFAALVETLVRFGPYVDEHHNLQKSSAERMHVIETAAYEKINDTPGYADVVTEIVGERVLLWRLERERQATAMHVMTLDAPVATDANGHVIDPVVYNSIVERVYSTSVLSEQSCSSSSASDEHTNIANFMGGSMLSLEHMVVRSIMKLATLESVMPVVIQGIRRLKHIVGQYSRTQPHYDLRALAILDMSESNAAASVPLDTYGDVLEFFSNNGNASPTHQAVMDTLVQSLKAALDGEINFLNHQDLDSLLIRGCSDISKGSSDGASERPLIGSSVCLTHGRVAGGGFCDPINEGLTDNSHGVVANSAGSSERVLMLRTGEFTPRKVYCCQGFENDFMNSKIRGGCSKGCCSWDQLHAMMLAKGYFLVLSPEELKRKSESEWLHAQMSGLKSRMDRLNHSTLDCADNAAGDAVAGDIGSLNTLPTVLTDVISDDSDGFRSSVLTFLSRHCEMTPDKLVELESSVSKKFSDELSDLMSNGNAVVGGSSSGQSMFHTDGKHFTEQSIQLVNDDVSCMSDVTEPTCVCTLDTIGDGRSRSLIDVARQDFDDLVEASYEDQAEVEADHTAHLAEALERHDDEHILSEDCFQAHVVVEEMISISQAQLDEHAVQFHRKVEATYARYRFLAEQGTQRVEVPACMVSTNDQRQLLDFSHSGLYDEISSWMPRNLWKLYVEYTVGGNALQKSLKSDYPSWDKRLLGLIHVARGMVRCGIFDLRVLGRIVENERDYRARFSSTELQSKKLRHLSDFQMLWIISTLSSIVHPWDGFMSVKVNISDGRITRKSIDEHMLLIQKTFSVYNLTTEQRYLVFVIQWTYMNFGECMHDICTSDWNKYVMGVTFRDLPKTLKEILRGEISRFWDFAHGDGGIGLKNSKSHLPDMFGMCFPSMSC